MKTTMFHSVEAHLTDDTPIEADSLDTGGRTIEMLRLGELADEVTVFVTSRSQAERLFDAVSELTLRWREREPALGGSIIVDATVAEVCDECGGTRWPDARHEESCSLHPDNIV